MPLSAAAILNAFLLILLVGATVSAAASVPAGDGDTNATMLTNGAATSSSCDDTEIYICYLCTGRNPLLIRYCPIYWDECHLVCYPEASAAIPDAAATVPPSLGSAHPASGVGDEECYVMKLYRNGSYAIVTSLGCAQIARCVLSCGGGDMADQKALGAATALPATTAAIRGRSFPPARVADFQRCGTQVTAPRTPPSAVVPAAGARRRR